MQLKKMVFAWSYIVFFFVTNPSDAQCNALCVSAGTASDQSDATLVEEQRSSCSPGSDALSYDSRKKSSDQSSAHSQSKSIYSADILGESERSNQR